ncbi:hypothetical protein M409DRAFT_61732 [Zasmidium cellare ATCC 36951]|uniref:JmjC domain-containing protein n=1 Tax=Zasmidium cellare ATCC 36951 TaxID=1080233 RepID=A0A6A6BXR9_ZASCE|nr:uncharacterized protein M409DRAFT_61732 [Zasmidium cellare ATCC 36951]KAF2158352.1 hypothetical protein M409DRAFT_61732 [Zasmidium cellare ATCC 36951]
MTTRLIPHAAVSAFRDSSGFPIPISASDNGTNQVTTADQRIIRKSSRKVAQRAASGEVGARLDCLSMDEVERAPGNTQLPDTEVSLLSLLQKQDTNQADAVKQVLNHMSDHAEEHALQMALVWRYAKEHESRRKPDRTTVYSVWNVHGRCAPGKINIIQRNWGEKWYNQARQRNIFPPAERGAASLSKTMLRLIANVSSSVTLSQALEFLEHAIQDRTAVGSRRMLGWKAATTTHLMLCDVQSLIAHVEEERPMSATKTSQKTQPTGSDEETLELISSKGISSLSAFGSSTQSKEVSARRTGKRKPQSVANNNSDIQMTRQEGRRSEIVVAATASQAGKRKTVEPLQLDHKTSREKRARIRMDRRQSIVDAPDLPLEAVSGSVIADVPPDGRQDHSTTTGTVKRPPQVDRAQQEKVDSHVVRDSATEREARYQSSTNSPTAEFEFVANGSASEHLEHATGPREKQHDQPLDSYNHCTSCGGSCSACEVPSGFNEFERRNLYSAAHRALELEARAPHATVRNWVKPIRYASCSVGLPQGPGEASMMPMNDLRRDLTEAIAPAFLRQDRFRLLDLLIERCKADATKHLGKQLHLLPFDVGGSRRFNILGWPGAFSGAHVDSSGATWVRNLFGQKLWMFVPEDLMTPADWEELAEDGDDWNPGNKARAIVLQPGDVFVMRPGLVHAVYTLGDSGPSLMIGGLFLDNQDLIHTLQTFHRIGKNQRITNEPISHQFAQIISSLECIIRRNSAPYFSTPEDLDVFTDFLTRLRALGCDCSKCDEECTCARESRRCTPLCSVHVFGDAMLRSCMSEEYCSCHVKSCRSVRIGVMGLKRVEGP